MRLASDSIPGILAPRHTGAQLRSRSGMEGIIPGTGGIQRGKARPWAIRP